MGISMNTTWSDTPLKCAADRSSSTRATVVATLPLSLAASNEVSIFAPPTESKTRSNPAPPVTEALLPLLGSEGRVVNLSSAAQAPVNLEAFLNKRGFSDGEAYAQSKLALTMWSFEMAKTLGPDGPVIIAVNPASFLGSKMVKEAYGQAGHDLRIGADILTRAALSDEFATATGRYYDNDRKAFTDPHPDALNASKNKSLIEAIEQLIT